MATLTLTEALVKLKQTEKKITQATSQAMVGVVSVGSNVPPGFKSQEEFKAEVKRRIDSVEGLIKFRDALKSSIVRANANTTVVVGSQTMTIAEAVERKNSIKFRKELIGHLSNQWNTLEKAVSQQNVSLENRADQFLAQLFGNREKTEDSQNERNQTRSTWISNNTVRILSHDKVKSIVEEMDREVSDFEANVDVALSVANAKTEIVVPD